MRQQHRDQALLQLAAGLFAAAVTGGCGASLGPTTGSLFGSSQATAATPAPAPIVDPTARALQVGAVSARASRCGFNFDPAKLKSAFLASEAKSGATTEQVQKVEREYEFTRLSVAQKIGGADDYCSDSTTRVIKADLARHLSGDFSPPVAKQVAQTDGGWFSPGYTSSEEKKPFGHGDVFDPMTGRPKNASQ